MFVKRLHDLMFVSIGIINYLNYFIKCEFTAIA